MILASVLKQLSTKLPPKITQKPQDNLNLNEAINFDLKSIFIAVPKTGTTSVRTQIRPPGKQLISAPHLNIIQVRDIIYPYLLKKALGKNSEFPTKGTVSDQELREESYQIFSTFFKFSSVRNPWARAVSLYHRREGVKVSKQMTFETFCEHHFYASDTCYYPTLHVNQIDWLVDESDELVMDYVYKVEDFDKALKEIEEQTDGRIKLKVRQSNKNPKSKSNSYRDVYSDHARKIIAKQFEKDIDFFKYTF